MPARWSALAASLMLAAGLVTALVTSGPATAAADVPTDVAPAECGPGSSPETGLQGQVPLADRQSGRSKLGYSCNLELDGSYQGQGQATVGASYGNCMYLGTIFSGSPRAEKPGVNVVDVSDPAHPKLTDSLASPATLGGTWETLKVHEGRGLLAAVSTGLASGGLFVSVYDVKTDCKHPKLHNGLGGTPLTLPGVFPGHESGWSPDGKTYWSTSSGGGAIAALDMTRPSMPRTVFLGNTGISNHGFGVSPDGKRIYVASTGTSGVTIFDSSDIQKRALFPRLRQLSALTWEDGQFTQHAIPFTDGGSPYLAVVDEFGSGGVRIVDISDDRNPRIVRKLKLEINRPENAETRNADVAGNGLFGYEAHYCTMDRLVEPRALACGWTQSGIRVFDVRDVMHPREIAYFNPPAQVGKREHLVNSAHATLPVGQYGSDGFYGQLGPVNLTPPDMTADWCMSPPRFVGNRLYVSCDDNGALALRFTNGAYPIP